MIDIDRLKRLCRKSWFFLLGSFLFLFFSTDCHGQTFFAKMSRLHSSRDKIHKATKIPSSAATQYDTLVSKAADQPPTINTRSLDPKGPGGMVTIAGANFDKHTTVKFGNTPAASVHVISNTLLTAVVGTGSSGKVVIRNSIDSVSGPLFQFIPLPTIASITHVKSGSGTMITITGTNFYGPASISINDGVDQPAFVSDTSTAGAFVQGTPIITDIAITTPGGVATLSATVPAEGSADLNLPDFSNGLTLIPAPNVNLAQLYGDNSNGLSEHFWANPLGTDSSLSRVGANFLSPDISIGGFAMEYDYRFGLSTPDFSLGTAVECNFLVKKVSYFNQDSNSTTNFTPLVIQPRLGLVSAFANNCIQASLYCNVLSVTGGNDEFTSFFATHNRFTFVFPELDIGGLLYTGTSGNSAAKLQFKFVLNNGDAQFITRSNDKIIPYIKIGYVTAL
jgi:IPT/TIG domain